MSIGSYIRTSVIAVFLIAACVFVVYLLVTGRQDMSVINMITEQQIGHNEFILDGHNIGVESAADLGFYVHPNEIELHYGKQVIYIKMKSLKNKDFMDKLNAIGIKIYQKEDQYMITYWDEVIVQWVE